MNIQHELIGIGLLSAGVLLILALAEVWTRVGKPSPESTRKAVHLAGGLLCLLLPLAVESAWTVLVAAAAIMGIFMIGERAGSLQCLHRVERTTHGSEFFHVAVFLLFILSSEQYWLYASCILVLTVADAAAALVGKRFGKRRYTSSPGAKSVEGSLAFFVVAFTVVSVAMLAHMGWSDWHVVWSALLVAASAAAIEVFCGMGSDNLVIPLWVWATLTWATQQPTDVVATWGIFIAAAAAAAAIITVSRTRRLRL